MSTLRTSILIPTHNRHDILTRVLDSIAQVDVPQGADVEVIVVANACTDQTVAMVQQRTHAFPFTLR